MPNQILSFYRDNGKDHRGRTRAWILAQDDAWLELKHDYVQWLFPDAQPSRFSPDAPLLDKATVAAFHADSRLQDTLRESLVRMLAFYGLCMENKQCIQADNWAARKSNWFTRNTHNSLRITRILKSLSALGLKTDAQAFKRGLRNLCETEADCGIDRLTRRFWADAAP
jgi:hypothetical protein